jgi:ADP-ribose pyrophosphatase YjhB (NUDIX family)
MHYTTLPAAIATQHISLAAERQVRERTGLRVSVLQYPTEQINNTPQRMLHVIALALDMSPECFRMKPGCAI